MNANHQFQKPCFGRVILAVATLLLLSITACNKLPPTYNGIDITGAET